MPLIWNFTMVIQSRFLGRLPVLVVYCGFAIGAQNIILISERQSQVPVHFMSVERSIHVMESMNPVSQFHFKYPLSRWSSDRFSLDFTLWSCLDFQNTFWTQPHFTI